MHNCAYEVLELVLVLLSCVYGIFCYFMHILCSAGEVLLLVDIQFYTNTHSCLWLSWQSWTGWAIVEATWWRIEGNWRSWGAPISPLMQVRSHTTSHTVYCLLACRSMLLGLKEAVTQHLFSWLPPPPECKYALHLKQQQIIALSGLKPRWCNLPLTETDAQFCWPFSSYLSC